MTEISGRILRFALHLTLLLSIVTVGPADAASVVHLTKFGGSSYLKFVVDKKVPNQTSDEDVRGTVDFMITMWCNTHGRNARRIMLMRQAEAPLGNVMLKIRGRFGIWQDFYKELVLQAYKELSFSTDKNKNLAINKFGNDVELLCYETPSLWEPPGMAMMIPEME